jgi:hypothetical protein
VEFLSGQRQQRQRGANHTGTTQNDQNPAENSQNRPAIGAATADRPSPENATEQKYRQSKEDRYWKVQNWTARVMAVFTAVGGIVGLGGLYILYGTLRATDQQAKLAYEQSRPWITVEPEFTGDIAVNDAETGFPIGFNLNNLGHSPAFDVLIDYDIRPYGFLEPQPDQSFEFCDVYKQLGHIRAGPWLPPGSHPIEVKNSVMMVPTSAISQAANSNDRNSFWVLMVGCISYRIPGETRIHQTPFIFEFYQWLPEHPRAMSSFKYAPNAIYPYIGLRMRQIYKNGDEPT